MVRSRLTRPEKDRRKAVFLCVGALALALGGCALPTSQKYPLLATLTAFIPSHSDYSDRAAKVPYASVDFTLGRRSALLILAQQSPGLTFWRSSRAETFVLRRGYLESTSGLPAHLDMTELSGLDAPSAATPWTGDLNKPRNYRVLRAWQTSDAKLHTERASAHFECAGGTEKVKLPLATLSLKKCTEDLTWASGKQTQSTYWIDPKDNRIWAANTTPWPGATSVDWQIARPWW